MRCIKAFALVLMIPSLVWADGVLTPAASTLDATLYDYRSSIRVQDEFLGAAASTGNIGSLGWGVSAGTTTQSASTAGRYGLITRDTSASSGTAAMLVLNGNVAALILPDSLHKITFVAKLNQVDANTAVWYGAGSSGASVPNDGIWIEKRDADTNWFCVTRASSSQTRTDSGVAATTNYTTFTYDRTTSNVVFSINSIPVCTHTATIPTVGLDPGAVIVNSAAASKTHTIDYFEMTITGLSR